MILAMETRRIVELLQLELSVGRLSAESHVSPRTRGACVALRQQLSAGSGVPTYLGKHLDQVSYGVGR